MVSYNRYECSDECAECSKTADLDLMCSDHQERAFCSLQCHSLWEQSYFDSVYERLRGLQND